MTTLDELTRARRRQRNAVLVGLDLLRHTDSQGGETLSRQDGATKSRGSFRSFAMRSHSLNTVLAVASTTREAGKRPPPRAGGGDQSPRRLTPAESQGEAD